MTTRSIIALRTKLCAAVLATAAAVAVIAVPATASAGASPETGAATPKATVVLVHGAWADSSSWDGVISRLIGDGYPVHAFATPLDSLSGDARALRTYLDSITGPIILVGHSYGGAVITNAATNDPQVRALVYIDAFAPKQGELVSNLAGANSAIADPSVFNFVPAGAPVLTTEFYIKDDAFIRSVANDIPRRQAAVLAATQRPITLQALNEPSGQPAWASIPSWYEVGTIDKIIPPAQQLAMAHTAHAHITTARTGHLPMISDPGAVVSTILSAARATH